GSIMSERYAHFFSIYNVLNWALSILIGLVFAISCSAYFFGFATFTTSSYIITCIGAIFAYIILTRLIHPVWKTWPAATRYGVISASIALATTVILLVPPTSVGSLIWQQSVGPTAGQAANIFPARSWGSAEQQVIELHASENPDAPQPKTTFGIWQATASLSSLLNRAPGRLRFYITQPDWAIIDQQTGRTYQDGDGVTVLFKADQAGRWQTVQQIYLNPSIQPDQRRWQPVDVDIP